MTKGALRVTKHFTWKDLTFKGAFLSRSRGPAKYDRPRGSSTAIQSPVVDRRGRGLEWRRRLSKGREGASEERGGGLARARVHWSSAGYPLVSPARPGTPAVISLPFWALKPNFPLFVAGDPGVLPPLMPQVGHSGVLPFEIRPNRVLAVLLSRSLTRLGRLRRWWRRRLL